MCRPSWTVRDACSSVERRGRAWRAAPVLTRTCAVPAHVRCRLMCGGVRAGRRVSACVSWWQSSRRTKASCAARRRRVRTTRRASAAVARKTLRGARTRPPSPSSRRSRCPFSPIPSLVSTRALATSWFACCPPAHHLSVPNIIALPLTISAAQPLTTFFAHLRACICVPATPSRTSARARVAAFYGRVTSSSASPPPRPPRRASATSTTPRPAARTCSGRACTTAPPRTTRGARPGNGIELGTCNSGLAHVTCS
jgi:hypothetical protein